MKVVVVKVVVVVVVVVAWFHEHLRRLPLQRHRTLPTPGLHNKIPAHKITHGPGGWTLLIISIIFVIIVCIIIIIIISSSSW